MMGLDRNSVKLSACTYFCCSSCLLWLSSSPRLLCISALIFCLSSSSTTAGETVWASCEQKVVYSFIYWIRAVKFVTVEFACSSARVWVLSLSPKNMHVSFNRWFELTLLSEAIKRQKHCRQMKKSSQLQQRQKVVRIDSLYIEK